MVTGRSRSAPRTPTPRPHRTGAFVPPGLEGAKEHAVGDVADGRHAVPELDRHIPVDPNLLVAERLEQSVRVVVDRRAHGAHIEGALRCPKLDHRVGPRRRATSPTIGLCTRGLTTPNQCIPEPMLAASRIATPSPTVLASCLIYDCVVIVLDEGHLQDPSEERNSGSGCTPSDSSERRMITSPRTMSSSNSRSEALFALG